MELFDGILTIKSVGFLMLSVLLISALGYVLGRITIKGVSLGTAGVFIVALAYGMLFHDELTTQLVVGYKDSP